MSLPHQYPAAAQAKMPSARLCVDSTTPLQRRAIKDGSGVSIGNHRYGRRHDDPRERDRERDHADRERHEAVCGVHELANKRRDAPACKHHQKERDKADNEWMIMERQANEPLPNTHSRSEQLDHMRHQYNREHHRQQRYPGSTEEERASGCGWVLRCSWDNRFCTNHVPATGSNPGRDGRCRPPPGQIRTCALTHTAPPSGQTAPTRCRSRVARVTPNAGAVSRQCRASPASPPVRPFAPSTPPRVSTPLCSPPSSLLWPDLIARPRASTDYGIALSVAVPAWQHAGTKPSPPRSRCWTCRRA